MGVSRYLIRGLVKAYRRDLLRKTLAAKARRARRSWLDDLENTADIYSLTPQFDERGWEEGYTEVIDSMVELAGNAGQETLLTDYFPDPAKDYCRRTEQDYDPDEFIQYVKVDLGDTYYYAINEIIDECASILTEVWDMNYQNDNPLEWLVGSGDRSTPGRIFESNSAALRAYQTNMARNGYLTGGGSAASAVNRQINRNYLIQRFGSGTTQAWRSSSGLERTPGYAAYQQAAARNGKIIKP